MSRRKTVAIAGILTGLILGLTGCSMDVETLLQPPHAQGEQHAVQAALETYLKDTGMAAARYTPQYPSEGEHTSAFVLCDNTGKPTTLSGERATYAVAFYALSTLPDETHVNLLRREGDEWVSVGDTVGYGADIRQVAFGDLNGDGMGELLTGWSTYHSQEHRLAIFSMGRELQVLSTDRVYNQMFVGDITATGEDSLLLLHINGVREVTATLEQLRDDMLFTSDRLSLDGYIRQFGGMTLCRLTEGVHGLYVDGIKTENSMVTELIYYADGKLVNPFYDAETNTSPDTFRPMLLPAADMDGDSLVEIPGCSPLPGYTTQTANHSTAWLTTWRQWDYQTKTWKEGKHVIRNTTDGYMVFLGEQEAFTIISRYDAATHTLDLMKDANKVWLRLCVGEQPEPVEGLEQVEVFKPQENTNGCTAWYDATELDEEKVRYMVVGLTGGKGE